MSEARLLGAGDEQALLEYLDANPDETIELRRAHGDGGATFAASFQDGRITGLAVHDRVFALHLHSASELEALARACLRPEGAISAVAGPPEQVEAAIAMFDLGRFAVRQESREIFMALDLDELVLPPLLERPGIVVRRARDEEMALLEGWMVGFYREIHSMMPDEDVLAEVRASQASGGLWVLEDDGAVVNTACFRTFPGLVHIAYAYSPRELRSQQYGRSAVAGALNAVRQEGIRRAVFTTGEKNLAVQVGIQPIGFRTVARYRVVVFAAQTPS